MVLDDHCCQHSSFCDSCVPCLKAALAARRAVLAAQNAELAARDATLAASRAETAARDAALAAQNAELAARDATLAAQKTAAAALDKKIAWYKTITTTLDIFAKDGFQCRNETASSSHCNTGHKVAEYQNMDRPTTNIDLPEDFWTRPVVIHIPKHVDSEADVKDAIKSLIKAVIVALGFQKDIDVSRNVAIMDTKRDFSLVTSLNRMLMGSIECKKPARGENEHNRIFGSETPVAGEVFEQLTLTHIQKKIKSVGLLSTLTSNQLVSLEDVGTTTFDLPSIREYFTAQKKNDQTTPDKRQAIEHRGSESVAAEVKKRPKVEPTPRPTKTPGQKKNGRVAIRCSEKIIAREYFATDPISFGKDEETNRDVIKLLAAFVLLSVNTLMNTPPEPLVLTSQTECLTRRLDANKGSFAFQEICLPEGIQFHALPTTKDRVFYLIRQLNFGASGVCCFGCTNDSAPCAVKIYLETDEEAFEMAKKEETMWRTLYDGLDFGFVKAYASPRMFLVMPYLRVPCTSTDREVFVKDEQNSLLYKALQYIVKKGYTHKEPRWHHIGLINIGHAEMALFCDLDHITKHKFDETEANEWVQVTFEQMKKRMAEEPEVPETIQVV